MAGFAMAGAEPYVVKLGTDSAGSAVMTVYEAGSPTGVAVVGCPGGGYEHLAYKHEGHQFADYFTSQGVAYAVVEYRFPKGNPEIPFTDVVRAMEIMRDKGLQQVGIMGFSAGGHLASTVATQAKGMGRPDFQILFYPVITMDSVLTHAGSRRNLLGSSPSEADVLRYSSEANVSASTPPAIIFHSGDDTLVPVDNSIVYYRALNKAGVPADLHIFDHGGHGWGFHDDFDYKPQWTALLRDWLSRRKASLR